MFSALNDEFNQDILLRIIEDISEGFMICQLLPFKALYANREFVTIAGQHSLDYIQDFAQLLHGVHEEDDKKLKETLHDFTNDLQKGHTTFRLTTAQQSCRWFSLHLYPVQINQIHYGIAQLEDISHQVTQSWYSPLVEESLGILRHDLIGAFASAEGVVGLLKTKLPSSTMEETFGLATLVEQTCKEARGLVINLLDNFRTDIDKLTLQKESVLLDEELSELMSIFQVRAEQNNIRFKLNIDQKHQPYLMELDKAKFQQVIKNLLSNAIKFTKPGGAIEIEVKEHAHDFLIRISDTGIGIPKKLRPFIFEKFSQARRVGIQGEHPTGLGTYITKKMVELASG